MRQIYMKKSEMDTFKGEKFALKNYFNAGSDYDPLTEVFTDDGEGVDVFVKDSDDSYLFIGGIHGRTADEIASMSDSEFLDVIAFVMLGSLSKKQDVFVLTIESKLYGEECTESPFLFHNVQDARIMMKAVVTEAKEEHWLDGMTRIEKGSDFFYASSDNGDYYRCEIDRKLIC